MTYVLDLFNFVWSWPVSNFAEFVIVLCSVIYYQGSAVKNKRNFVVKYFAVIAVNFGYLGVVGFNFV